MKISNDSTTATVENLLNERGETYGDTWLLAGQVMGVLQLPFANLLRESPWMAHNWVLILSKLIRILFAPNKEDNWIDLIGYATLVHRWMVSDHDVSGK